MIRWLASILVVAMICCGWQGAFAVGTTATTTISTQATASYTIGVTPLTLTSNLLTDTVDEVLDAQVTWQDGAAVTVFAQQTDRVLTFRITNTGNGSETFTLAASSAQSGDQFDPVLSALYLDSNSNNLFEAGVDTQYVAGTNDPVLAPDASVTVFVLNNIPANLSDADTGHCLVTLTANTGSGAIGTALPGQGDGGTDAVIGGTGASAATQGTYVVSGLQMSVVKSVTVVDTHGGDRPSTAAVMTYQITVQATGSGTAQTVVFTDPIPEHTTYRPDSLRLNGTLLSDAADSDVGDVGATTAGSVTVALGDLAAGSAAQTISFDVTID
jgi:uncharacterized repeat protein (TIGR01451 family)